MRPNASLGCYRMRLAAVDVAMLVTALFFKQVRENYLGVIFG